MLPENRKDLLVTGWKNHIYIEQTKPGYVFSDEFKKEIKKENKNHKNFRDLRKNRRNMWQD